MEIDEGLDSEMGRGEPCPDVFGRIERWVERYVDRLTHLAFTYVHDWSTAEDMVQEAFLKAYRSIRGLKSEEYALPWLMRIVINECRTYLRRTRREVIMVDPPDLASTSAESEYFRTWDQRRVFRAVMGLPEKYRVPVYLFYVEGMATQEIADVLRIRPGTVRVRLLRGRRLLQRRLSEEDVCRLEEQGGEEIQNEDERGVARDDRPGSAVGGAHSPGGGLLPLSHRR